MPSTGLAAQGISVRYGKALAVRGAGLTVAPGSLTTLVGPNGAGKSSLLHAIQGVVPSEAQDISLGGRSLLGMTATTRVKAGLVLVPQGRQLFRHLTVRDNLRVVADAFGIRRGAVGEALDRFPILRTREKALGGVLSGGEQQMLALARALMCDPSVLMLDEPTMGLAPSIIRNVIDALLEMREQGKSILIAEPTTRILPAQMDRGYIIFRGSVVGEAQSLVELERAYQAHFEAVPADERCRHDR